MLIVAQIQAAITMASDFVDGVDVIVGSAGTSADLAGLRAVVGLPLGAAAPGAVRNITQSLESR